MPTGSSPGDPQNENNDPAETDDLLLEISENVTPAAVNDPDSFRGNVVGEIEESLPPDASLDAVELNPLSLPEQRFRLAKYMLALVGLLGFMIIGSAFVASDESYAQVKELAPIIFTPLVTLLGTCVAWYYASNKKDL